MPGRRLRVRPVMLRYSIPEARTAASAVPPLLLLFVGKIGGEKSRKSVALRLTVFAADALTASDRHDVTASNIARIRFFFTLNTSC